MSDTPRTDNNVGRVNNHFVFYTDTEEGDLVRADFARELERELAEMREQRYWLVDALKLFLNRVKCVSIHMDGKPRGCRFDYRSSGFDAEVEHAYEALEAVTGANQ